MARKELIKAVAYLRTSSATNVGEDKDSAKRGGASEENQKLTRFLQSAGRKGTDQQLTL